MMTAEPWNPHQYQIKAVSWLINHTCAGLFLDPGLGKTSITLKAFQRLKEARKTSAALVIAPLRVCNSVWTHNPGGELKRWSDFAGLKVAFLHGKGREAALTSNADLYVINFDGLPWLVAKDRLRNLLRRGVDTLIVDELSKFKHTRTKRFKLIKPWLNSFKRRWGLTGSPASNGLLDLFGQLYVIDQGTSLGQYITHYRAKYFTPTGYGGYTWVLQRGADHLIYKAIGDRVLSMRATDHLDLPLLVEQDVLVDLPSNARLTYDQLEKDLITQIDGATVTAANAAVASLKCRQVASGGLYVDEWSEPNSLLQRRRTTKHVHDTKTEALVDLVDELQGSPLLVAFEFRHDLDRIRAALGDVPSIDGTTAPKHCAELIEAWNSGQLPVLCGHPQSVAHGINLQHSGSHICWYSVTWDLELYDQLNRRIWRQGNKAERVIVIRLVARNTVDTIITKVLSQKRRTQDTLFTTLVDYCKRSGGVH